MPGAVAKKKRKDDLTQEDRFLHVVEQGLAWVRIHQRASLVVLVGLALLVGGVLYYRSYRENLATRAALELNQLRATLTVADAIPRLTGFVARYDGTPSATDARLLLARLQLQTGLPQGALEALRPLASQPADVPAGFAVRILLAEAYKNTDAPERALSQLNEILEGAHIPYQRHRALSEKARLLAELGRLDEAAAAYRLLADEAPAENLYRLRLGEIEALLASGSPSAPSAFAAPGLPAPGDPSDSAADSAAADSPLGTLPSLGEPASPPSEDDSAPAGGP